jgi:hypothetical protein
VATLVCLTTRCAHSRVILRRGAKNASTIDAPRVRDELNARPSRNVWDVEGARGQPGRPRSLAATGGRASRRDRMSSCRRRPARVKPTSSSCFIRR